jgi:hypothetical protein
MMMGGVGERRLRWQKSRPLPGKTDNLELIAWHLWHCCWGLAVGSQQLPSSTDAATAAMNCKLSFLMGHFISSGSEFFQTISALQANICPLGNLCPPGAIHPDASGSAPLFRRIGLVDVEAILVDVDAVHAVAKSRQRLVDAG